MNASAQINSFTLASMVKRGMSFEDAYAKLWLAHRSAELDGRQIMRQERGASTLKDPDSGIPIGQRIFTDEQILATIAAAPLGVSTADLMAAYRCSSHPISKALQRLRKAGFVVMYRDNLFCRYRVAA